MRACGRGGTYGVTAEMLVVFVFLSSPAMKAGSGSVTLRLCLAGLRQSGLDGKISNLRL